MANPGVLRDLFLRRRALLWRILAAGTLSGLFSAALVAVINRLLYSHDDRFVLLSAAFSGLVAAKVFANLLSQSGLVRFAQDAVMDMTTALCSKVLRSSLRTIEQAGAGEIFTVLTDDVGSVVWAAQCLPGLIMNGAMVAGCGVYLLWLSPAAFAGVASITLMGAGGYYWLHRRSFPAMHAARDAKTHTFTQFHGLTRGIKELLMDRSRADAFLSGEVSDALQTLRRCNLSVFRHHLTGESWTQTLYYLLIGCVLVVFPGSLALTPEALTGFVFAMLYLMNPVWGIIGAFPTVSRGRIALSRIESLGLSLAEAEEAHGSPAAPMLALGAPVLSIEGVTFFYDSLDDQPGFRLGPLEFSLRPGELVFIVGGNGSGKSTFVRLLAGLYAPESGTITCGGMPVTDANRAWYRQHFAVVFSDYHLFERIHRPGPDTDTLARQYLQLLELEGKVTIKGGRWSTLDLSQGQRRRLALVAAYLQDKPIYVFDEWAADQDPHYKEVFYHHLLPDLCKRGKAVVVVTHDDRFFQLGDRVVKLEDGRIVRNVDPKTTAGRAAP
jgi:putative ATP-binding cassette transporter